MDRNSKTSSLRLSGIFDLFSEAKTGLDCPKDHPDEPEKRPKKSTEKKIGLFSFRKKAASDSKVYEKPKTIKQFFRQMSKPEKTASVLQDVGQREYGGVQDRDNDTVILRRSGKPFTVNSVTCQRKTTRDLILSPVELTGEEKPIGIVRPFSCPVLKDNPYEKTNFQQRSTGELSPTEKKAFTMVNKRPKLFKFSSRNKEKLPKFIDAELSDSKYSLEQNKSKGDADYSIKEMGEMFKSRKKILQLSSRCDDLVMITPCKSIQQTKVGTKPDEMSVVTREFDSGLKESTALVTDSTEKWTGFHQMKIEEKCREREPWSDIFVCTETKKDDDIVDKDNNTESLSQTNVVVPRIKLRNIICTFLYLIRNLYLSFKNLVIFLATFVIALPYNLFACLKSLYFFIVHGCKTVLLTIKRCVRRGDQPPPKFKRRKQEKQSNTILENEKQHYEMYMTDDTISKHLDANKMEFNELHSDAHDSKSVALASFTSKAAHVAEEPAILEVSGKAEETTETQCVDHDKSKRPCKQRAKIMRFFRLSSKTNTRKDLNLEEMGSDILHKEWETASFNEDQLESLESSVTMAKERHSSCCQLQAENVETDTKAKKCGVDHQCTWHLLLFIKGILRFPFTIILFIPLNVMKLFKCLCLKLSASNKKNLVKSKSNMTGETKHQTMEATKVVSREGHCEKSKVRSSLFKVFCTSNIQQTESDISRGHGVEECITSADRSSFSNAELELRELDKEARPYSYYPRVFVRKGILCGSVLLNSLLLCVRAITDFFAKIVCITFYCVKMVLLSVVRLFCFVLLLIKKVIMIVIRCFYLIISCVVKVIIRVVKRFCFIVLLILSLPLGTVVFLRFSVCFFVKICCRCYHSIVGKLKSKATRNVQMESASDSSSFCDDASKLFGITANQNQGKIDEKFQKKSGILRFLKRQKKSLESKLCSVELPCSFKQNNQDKAHTSTGSENGESEIQREQESRTSLFDPRHSIKLLTACVIELFFRLLSAVLSLPLGTFAVLSSVIHFFVHLFRTTASSLRSFVKPTSRSTEESLVDNAASGDFKKPAKFTSMRFFRQLSKSDGKSEKKTVSPCAEQDGNELPKDMQNPETLSRCDTVFHGPSRLGRASESEQDKKPRRNPFDPRLYMVRFIPFLNIFFQLQYVFAVALWQRINLALSCVCKMVLMTGLRLTPKVVVKWSMILVCRYTPGVRNRKIILQFLKETPAQVTKKLAEAYLKRVTISVMLVHAQMSLKDSPSKKIVWLVSMMRTSVTKFIKRVFIGVSCFFKEIAQALRVRGKKENLSTKERMLLRLKNESGFDSKDHGD